MDILATYQHLTIGWQGNLYNLITGIGDCRWRWVIFGTRDCGNIPARITHNFYVHIGINLTNVIPSDIVRGAGGTLFGGAGCIIININDFIFNPLPFIFIPVGTGIFSDKFGFLGYIVPGWFVNPHVTQFTDFLGNPGITILFIGYCPGRSIPIFISPLIRIIIIWFGKIFITLLWHFVTINRYLPAVCIPAKLHRFASGINPVTHKASNIPVSITCFSHINIGINPIQRHPANPVRSPFCTRWRSVVAVVINFSNGEVTSITHCNLLNPRWRLTRIVPRGCVDSYLACGVICLGWSPYPILLRVFYRPGRSIVIRPAPILTAPTVIATAIATAIRRIWIAIIVIKLRPGIKDFSAITRIHSQLITTPILGLHTKRDYFPSRVDAGTAYIRCRPVGITCFSHIDFGINPIQRHPANPVCRALCVRWRTAILVISFSNGEIQSFGVTGITLSPCAGLSVVIPCRDVNTFITIVTGLGRSPCVGLSAFIPFRLVYNGPVNTLAVLPFPWFSHPVLRFRIATCSKEIIFNSHAINRYLPVRCIPGNWNLVTVRILGGAGDIEGIPVGI